MYFQKFIRLMINIHKTFFKAYGTHIIHEQFIIKLFSYTRFMHRAVFPLLQILHI